MTEPRQVTYEQLEQIWMREDAIGLSIEEATGRQTVTMRNGDRYEWTPEPTPPVNARIIRNGESIPLDLTYRGINSDGIHEWGVANNIAINPDTDHVRVDQLPPKTSIAFPADLDFI